MWMLLFRTGTAPAVIGLAPAPAAGAENTGPLARHHPRPGTHDPTSCLVDRAVAGPHRLPGFDHRCRCPATVPGGLRHDGRLDGDPLQPLR